MQVCGKLLKDENDASDEARLGESRSVEPNGGPLRFRAVPFLPIQRCFYRQFYNVRIRSANDRRYNSGKYLLLKNLLPIDEFFLM